VRDSGDVGSADRLVLEREPAQRLEDDRPLVGGEPHADPLSSWCHMASRTQCGDLLPSAAFRSAAVFVSTADSGLRLVGAFSAAVAPGLRQPRARSTIDPLPITRRCPSMCHEWWMSRQLDEAEEGRRLCDEFERTRPLTEPEVALDEPEVTLDEREGTPTPAER
jgi:hypothetical protein